MNKAEHGPKSTGEINRVGILGLGLIGGSLAKALRAKTQVATIVAMDTDASSGALALSEGVIDAFSVPAEGYSVFNGCDLVLLCAPLPVIIHLLPELAALEIGTVAAASDTRPADLRKPVNIKGADIHFLLDLIPHLRRPRFCSENARLQLDLIQPHALRNHLVCDVQHIGGRAHNDRRLPFAQYLDLSGRIAPRYRDGGCTHRITGIVRSETPGKESVSVSNMNHITFFHAGTRHRPAHTFRPQSNVISRIADDFHAPGRSG